MRFVWMLSTFGLAGCGGGHVELEDFDPSDPEKPGQTLDEEVDEDGVDRRVFALVEVVSTLLVNPSPLSNKEEATATYSYKHVAWERDDLDVTWTETLCGLEATEIFGTQTLFPDALVDTFPQYVRHGTVSEAVTGAEFTAGPVYTVMGAELDDPATDSLPTSAQDDRVFDQDQDGHPGVTVKVDQSILGTARLHLVQRERNVYDGVLASTERVEGHITNRGQQNILGATTSWAEQPTERRPDPDRAHSWFVFQSIGEDVDCGDIMRDRTTLFE